MKCVMSIFVLGLTCLSNFVTNDSIIPSQAEQANLLLNVQEVFEQIKLLTKDEVNSTNISVARDIELMVKRAEYILELLQQITQLRLSSDGNSVCSLDGRQQIKQLTRDGKEALRNCSLLGTQDIEVSSDQLTNVTDTAIDKGQVLLDDLGACSKKGGLGVISCYKGIIATDVVPVKNVMLDAIRARKDAHFEALDIRQRANVCVDEIVASFRGLFENTLRNAIQCN